MNEVLPIAREALSTAWHHKRLWALGSFVAASAGGLHLELSAAPGVELPPALALLAPLAIVVMLVWLAIHAVAQGALVFAVREQRRGHAPDLRLAVLQGLASAGRMLGLIAVTWAATLVPVLAIATPVLLGVAEVLPLPLALALAAVAAIVAAPVVLSVHVAHEVGARLLVLEQRRGTDALRAGLRFLRGRLRLALKLLVVDALAEVALGIVALPLVLAAVALGAAIYAVAGIEAAIVVGLLLLLPIALAANGARGTFRSALWTHCVLDERPGIA